MVKKIAIAGNIASGKSQVERILKQRGYTVYDSDDIAHDVLDSLTGFYGYDVFTDGKIDRKKLGNLVFSNQELRKKLELIVHPLVKKRIIELFDKHSNEKYIFISVPLLFEAGFDSIFDKVIFVSVSKDIQLKRLMKRNNLSEKEANLRINSQIKQEEKIEKADFVIDNNLTIDNLDEQISNILNQLVSVG